MTRFGTARHAGLTLACAIGIAGTASAQQIHTYTQSETGATRLPYGLPVPLPIDSLTPVDGFRSYASLEARLQGLALSSSELSAHDIGRTINNRTLWAYVVGDEDGVDVEGRPEAAYFINATTHAREWAAPEVSTGTIERLVAGADDGGLTRYLLDNTRLVIIPVHNVDGFLQAQRYPTDVIVGQDPRVPTTWPRDGRMRRKNMRGADEVLATFGDHLNGIDLNRNHPPFHATSNQSSSNPAELVYHGTAPHSEPENMALRNAATLGPATRFRLGIDVHTFSKVFFSSNTARTRLNAIQTRLIGSLSAHHEQVSGKSYTNVPDPANRGIGAAAEYFAYEWLVPAWTLELEPTNDAREYGGTSVEHGGFILPAAEARRVRESWAETHAVAFYMMAGPPHLARLRMVDVESGVLALETRWQYDAQSARRTLQTPVPGSLQPGRRYRAELGFSKPMRRLDAAGAILPLPGLFAPRPNITLTRGEQRLTLDTASGVWQGDPARVLRYRGDTFAVEFTAPAEVADYRFEVAAFDMTSLALDADPSTPADWSAGAWSEWEDAAGVDSDVGGVDVSATLRVDAVTASLVEVVPDSRVIGEGDTVQLRLRRPLPGPERVDIHRFPPNGELSPLPFIVATWLPGESGERSVPIAAGENLIVDGDRSFDVVLGETVDNAPRPLSTMNFRVLDNDSETAVVYVERVGSRFGDAWFRLASAGTPARELVLHGDVQYDIPVSLGESPPPRLNPVFSDLTVHGNRALLRPRHQRREAPPLIEVDVQGKLTLRDVRLELGSTAPNSSLVEGLLNEGETRIERSVLTTSFLLPPPGTSADEAIRSSGRLEIDRSSIRDVLGFQTVGLIAAEGGVVRIASSTLGGNSGGPTITHSAGQFSWHGSSFIGNQSGFGLIGGGFGVEAASFGHMLIQDNSPSGQISPSVLQNCDRSGSSLGFNIENYTACGFTQSTDRSGLDLGDFTFDAALGGYAPIGVAIDGGATAAQAAASGCGLVDQRGAPRPQTLTPGAEPRCDIGAIELGVNPYRGIWQPERAGHGVDIQTSGNSLFLAWYTYEDDGEPTAYQAIAPLTGPHWEANLQVSSRDPQSGQVTQQTVGRVTLDFTSDTDAHLGWRFDARGTTGSERIRPSLFAPGEPRFEVTGLWYPPEDSGYGATISRRGEITALGLYYYDAQGNIRWALGTANAADAIEMQMTSYTGFCPDCDAAAMPATGRPAGTLLAHFHTPERARLDMQLTYPGAAGGVWNKQLARFVPINDPVDNRAAAAQAGR